MRSGVGSVGNARSPVTRLALRVAMQFSLAYGLASLVLGMALGFVERILPLDAVAYWLVVRLGEFVPAEASPLAPVADAAVTVLAAAGLALANVLLVAVLLFPILRWNLTRARFDLADAFD